MCVYLNLHENRLTLHLDLSSYKPYSLKYILKGNSVIYYDLDIQYICYIKLKENEFAEETQITLKVNSNAQDVLALDI